jgi:hypothetical protein
MPTIVQSRNRDDERNGLIIIKAQCSRNGVTSVTVGLQTTPNDKKPGIIERKEL